MSVWPTATTAAPVDPVPAPLSSGIAVAGAANFDPATGSFFKSGPIIAVQFPGEIVSDTDPLVTLGAVLTMSGTFSGTSLDSASLDTSGVFTSLTYTVTLGKTLLFRESVSGLDFTGFYTSGGSTGAMWVGPKESVTNAYFDNAAGSPFLAGLDMSPPSPDGKPNTQMQKDAYGMDMWVATPAPVMNPISPEPVTFGVATLGLVVIAASIHVRAKRRNRASFQRDASLQSFPISQ
jgi:hypothetical protein